MTRSKNEKTTFDNKSKKTYKETESTLQKGTKKFQERMIQTKEAEEEIKNYKDILHEEW